MEITSEMIRDILEEDIYLDNCGEACNCSSLHGFDKAAKRILDLLKEKKDETKT